MTDWSRVEGLLGAEGLRLLARRRVAIVGLGSGGGAVALSLAMSGVGRFVLVDPERLEAGNVLRHVADRRDIGRAKVGAVADLMRQRNPELEIETRAGRIEEHMDALDGVDLLVAAVDSEPARHLLNEAALERRLRCVYAGVYERGAWAGDVARAAAGAGACYACWAAELRDQEGWRRGALKPGLWNDWAGRHAGGGAGAVAAGYAGGGGAGAAGAERVAARHGGA